MDNPTKKRLSVDLPLEFHQCLKDIANAHNITVTKLIEALVIQLIKQEGLAD